MTGIRTHVPTCQKVSSTRLPTELPERPTSTVIQSANSRTYQLQQSTVIKTKSYAYKQRMTRVMPYGGALTCLLNAQPEVQYMSVHKVNMSCILQAVRGFA